MTPELKQSIKTIKRQRALRVIRNNTGEFILFAFPFLVFASITLVLGMTLIASYALDIPTSTLWGL
jgi:cellobiose-specific phosphotransferase system component IIC